jgi:lipoprotein-anchoring transpeptidase ErfK/SrfK
MVKFFPPLAVLFLILGGFVFLKIRPQNELESAVKIKEILDSNGEIDPTSQIAIYNNKVVPYSDTQLQAARLTQPVVLGLNNEEKWIEVDLTKQRLYAHEGGKVVMEFPISSGLPWTPTVTGDFRIWAKIFAQKMSGGEPGTPSYYYLPNVPFVQFFYKAYGLHGAYWHNDFGKPRSHGCVNLRPADARALYYWTAPEMGDKRFLANIKPENSTRVIIHGTTPAP